QAPDSRHKRLPPDVSLLLRHVARLVVRLVRLGCRLEQPALSVEDRHLALAGAQVTRDDFVCAHLVSLPMVCFSKASSFNRTAWNGSLHGSPRQSSRTSDSTSSGL